MPNRKDKFFMRQALALARVAGNRVAPNPLVGAVIVRDDRVLARGCHRYYGGPHAEVDALRQLGGNAHGATLYVTLEPCNHYGKTPPCTEAIIEAGISRVVVALRDPNPKVCGGGIEFLKAQGIEVTLGVCEEEARQMNRAWIFFLVYGRPLVTLKLALSFDGKIAYVDNSHRWLSSTISRAQVQRMRALAPAIMIGAGTAIADDPLLTCRLPGRGQPMRVVVDSTLRSPSTLRIFSDLKQLSTPTEEVRSATLVATTDIADPTRVEDLKALGVEVVICPRKVAIPGTDVARTGNTADKVDLRFLLNYLGSIGKTHVLCEGGAELGAELFKEELCDELALYQAPIWLGESGIPFYSGKDPIMLGANLNIHSLRTVGKDLVLHFQSTALKDLRKAKPVRKRV